MDGSVQSVFNLSVILCLSEVYLEDVFSTLTDYTREELTELLIKDHTKIFILMENKGP